MTLILAAQLVLALIGVRAFAAEPPAYLRIQPTPEFAEPLTIRVGAVAVRAGGGWTPIAVTGAWQELQLVAEDPSESGQRAWFRPVAGQRYEAYLNPCSGYALFPAGATPTTGRIRVELRGDKPMDLLYAIDRTPLVPGENPWIELTHSSMCIGANQDVVVVRPGADRWTSGAVVCSASVHLLHGEDATVVCDPTARRVELR